MNKTEQFAPWVVVGAAVMYLIAMMAPPAEGPMRLEEFGALPMQDGGRIKPYDTLARNNLMILSNKQTFRDENDKEQPAIRWLLDVMSRRDAKHRVFRIDNPEVVALMGQEIRPGSRYSVNELGDRVDKLMAEARRIAKKDPKKLSAYEKGVHDLDSHLKRYLTLSTWPQSLFVYPPQAEGDDEWQSVRQARAELDEKAPLDGVPAIVLAYARNDAQKFNAEILSFREQLDKNRVAGVQRSGTESFFNHFAPFYQCTILYVFVFVLGCLSWLGWMGPLNRAAFWLAAVTLVVHSAALIGRMYLMNRWFVLVTSLYSSAVFIGWGCVALCLVLEKLFHNGLGVVVGAFCGAVTMLVAHHLGSDGDTLALLMPVLDTNFWLATHVTCVTLGYTATFVTGFLGLAYIIGGVLTPWLDRNLAKTVGQMLYGVLCFATLLSFTGTVLGGFWADQSWGRFWGWDPKENGAILIVIWNALILHARWGGMVKQRGMAVLAVAGNMVTGWSWFGTNQLGVGLHAYGFNDTLATGLVIFWTSQMVVIGMGLLPLRFWSSYAAMNAPIRPVVVEPEATEPFHGKRRGKRGDKRGDPGYFAGPA